MKSYFHYKKFRILHKILLAVFIIQLAKLKAFWKQLAATFMEKTLLPILLMV